MHSRGPYCGFDPQSLGYKIGGPSPTSVNLRGYSYTNAQKPCHCGLDPQSSLHVSLPFLLKLGLVIVFNSEDCGLEPAMTAGKSIECLISM